MSALHSTFSEPAFPAQVKVAAPATYRILFERMPLPAWVYDTETLRFLDVNPAASRKYGFSREEFLAMTIMDIRPAEDVPLLLELLDLPLAERKERARCWRHRTKAG